MAKTKKKPCEKSGKGRGGRVCIHQFADLCLAFNYRCWNTPLNQPGFGYKKRADVTLFECLEEVHVCPNTNRKLNGWFIPVPENDAPEHHDRYWSLPHTVREEGEE